MKSTALSILALLICGTLAGQVAAAPQINGSLGFIPFNSASFTGPVSAPTSITFASNEVINGLPATNNGLPNDFNSSNGFSILGSVFQSASALTIGTGGAISTPVSDFFGFANNRFQFNLTSGTETTIGQNIQVQGNGVLHDISGFYADTAASFTMFTNPVSGNQIINYNVTFSTSPVPEPESYAMLLAGLGLLGFSARRKKQKLS